MDIKEKFKTFIDKKTNKSIKQPPTSPAYLAASESWTSADFDNHLAVVGHQKRKTSLFEEVPLSTEAQDVVINTIEPIYFKTDNPDVGSHELQKFPDITDLHVINGIRSRLRKQQAIVSRRVSDLIISKQTACMEEMAMIDKLQKEACLAVALCVQSRKELSVGKGQFTSASLQVIANHLKRQRILEVMNNLKTIKTLQMTDIQLQKLLRAEAYPSAIQLLLECQTAASTFKHFSCISDLSTKLQETLEMAEEQLDCAVGRVVVNFNANTYAKLHAAYTLLNKRQALMDQLHMHLTSHIHNSAFSIVMGYVELYSSVTQLNSSNLANTSLNNSVSTVNNSVNCDKAPQSSFSKMQYSELCKYVDHECFLACYVDLGKSMFSILRNYKAISRWHHKASDEGSSELAKSILSETSSLRSSPAKSLPSDDSSVDERSYVEQKLVHGLYRIWQDVQSKLRTFILASDLSHFKFDDFLLVLDVTSRLTYIGEEFCGSKSEALQDSIKKQSMGFFHREHAARLEELHMFLENEAWQIVPLKPTFTVYQLLEYRFLKRKDASLERSFMSVTPSKKNDALWALDGTTSPFDLTSEELSTEEDILAPDEGSGKSDEDTDDDENSSVLDGQSGRSKDNNSAEFSKKFQAFSTHPVASNTCLAILRLVGKYLLMMKLLQPIAADVFVCTTQLVHYYLYTICTTFGLSGCVSNKLSSVLRRIEGEIIMEDVHQLAQPTAADYSISVTEVGSRTAKVYRAKASPIITDVPACSAEGVAARLVACESLLLLCRELSGLRDSVLPSLLPATAAQNCDAFFTDIEDVLPEVVPAVYNCVGAAVVPQQQLVQQMSGVNWSISRLESQHNGYVDQIVRLMQGFSSVLQSVKSRQPLPASAEEHLWRTTMEQMHSALLHGYATAKACTNEGRSLMQLDYQQLTSKLEPLCGLRPLPGRPLVENYIKAFYLPESALRDWLLEHRTEYNARHLAALVSVMSHIPKHTRSQILATLETKE